MGVRRNKGRWTSEEHKAFLRGLQLFERNWEAVASLVPTRTVQQIRTHSQKYFNKIDRGEDFPEEPYPSQYDAEAGKSGAAAGAYLYGDTQLETQRLTTGIDYGATVVVMEGWNVPPLAFPPQLPGGGNEGGGVGGVGGIPQAGGGDAWPRQAHIAGIQILGEQQQQPAAAATAGDLTHGIIGVCDARFRTQAPPAWVASSPSPSAAAASPALPSPYLCSPVSPPVSSACSFSSAEARSAEMNVFGRDGPQATRGGGGGGGGTAKSNGGGLFSKHEGQSFHQQEVGIFLAAPAPPSFGASTVDMSGRNVGVNMHSWPDAHQHEQQQEQPQHRVHEEFEEFRGFGDAAAHSAQEQNAVHCQRQNQHQEPEDSLSLEHLLELFSNVDGTSGVL